MCVGGEISNEKHKINVSELFTEFNPVQLLILPVMAIVGVYLFIFSLHLMKNNSSHEA